MICIQKNMPDLYSGFFMLLYNLLYPVKHGKGRQDFQYFTNLKFVSLAQLCVWRLIERKRCVCVFVNCGMRQGYVV